MRVWIIKNQQVGARENVNSYQILTNPAGIQQNRSYPPLFPQPNSRTNRKRPEFDNQESLKKVDCQQKFGNNCKQITRNWFLGNSSITGRPMEARVFPGNFHRLFGNCWEVFEKGNAKPNICYLCSYWWLWPLIIRFLCSFNV